MTAFITHCCKSCRPERWAAALCLLLVLCLAVPARAELPGEVVQMQLERSSEGLLLSARLQFELPELIEDALRQGIAIYFTTEAEVTRARWYWSDKVLAQAQRHQRLSYQPLTRRWRLHVADAPFDNAGLGLALGQSFDDYADALAALQRVSRWKIADPGQLDDGVRQQVQLRFRVDLSQLPRPLQIGALGQRQGWNLLLTRSQALVPLAESGSGGTP